MTGTLNLQVEVRDSGRTPIGGMWRIEVDAPDGEISIRNIMETTARLGLPDDLQGTRRVEVIDYTPEGWSVPVPYVPKSITV